MASLSFNIDWTQILSTATQMVNILFPIFVIPLGMKLGVKLLGVVRSAIESAF